MLAFHAFHLAAYHTAAHGTFQPPAATVASDLTPDTDATPDSFSYRAVACPLQWLPVLLAGAPYVFTTKGDLQTAVEKYDANSTNATATYGPIAGWDVSQITDMAGLFERRNGLRKENFNARTRPVSRA